MRALFADSGYWIALLNSRDELHDKAVSIRDGLAGAKIVTSEMVLVEVLDDAARGGWFTRQAASDLVTRLRNDPTVDIEGVTSLQFEQALDLYRSRPDQRWGLTDCASFLVMEERGITEALAYDRDFEQAGFVALLRMR